MAISAAAGAAIAGGSSAAGGFLQGHFNRKTQRRNVDKTILANRELSEYAYKMDLEQWHRQNQYNSPEAQMQRFKDAGLNPNLMYGQGTPGNATTSPDYKPPTENYEYSPFQVPKADISGAINQYQDIKMRQAQIDNVKAQTDKTIADTVSSYLMPEKIGADTMQSMYQGNMLKFRLENMLPNESELLKNQADASKYAPDRAATELQRAQILKRLEEMRFEYERDTGLQPQDAAWLRIIIKTLPSFGISNDTLMNVLGKKLWNQVTNPKNY